MSRLRFCKRYCIESEIGGEQVKFYSSSVTMLWRIREFAEPIVEALRAFMKSAQDQGVEKRSHFAMDDEDDGFGTSETIIRAIDPELARTRSNEQKVALMQVMHILDERTIKFVAEIIIDSLRDERISLSPEEFIEDCDIPTLVECLMGVWKANTENFGPLAKGVLSEIRETLKARIGTPQFTQSQESVSPEENLNEKPESSTSGTGSTMPSSGQAEGSEETSISSSDSISLDSERSTNPSAVTTP